MNGLAFALIVALTNGVFRGEVDWIAVPGVPVMDVSRKDFGKTIGTAPGASCFVKAIDVGTDVKSAFWTVTGQGVFEAFVNGRRVGDDFLKPGFTHVFKTRHSFSYDVTSLIKPGRNVLAAMVTAGWWSDKIAGYQGKERAFRAQLTVRYADGMEKVFGTDSSWLGAVAGPVKRASIFEGESYDARVETPWLTTGADESFAPVKTIDEFKGVIVPMEGPTVKTREDLVLSPVTAYVWREAVDAGADRFGKIVKAREYANGDPMMLEPGEKLVLDFGQNAAAVPRFRARAASGTRLVLKPAEMLNDGCGLKSRGNDGPEGSVYRANLRSLAKKGALAEYVFAGKGEETYMPRYTFFGYRYVSVETTGPVTFAKFESVPVTSISKEMEVGRITTGNKDVNRLIENVRWGQYSNYLSVPTDCPQRDERLGWTADTQVFVDAASRNADVYGFLCKWMRDVRDTQGPKGGFLGIAPGGGPYGNESMRLGWSDAGVIVPYKMWKRYGDTRIVRENFEAMDRFMRRVNETKYAHEAIKGESGLYQWADWLSMEPLETFSSRAFVLDEKGNRVRPKPEALRYWDYLGACHWLSDARMMSEMAAAVGRDPAPYETMAKDARDDLRQFFGADGMLEPLFSEMQTPALFALKHGLVDGEAKAKTVAALRRNFAAHGDCLQTGFLGTSILMETLTENGLVDLAYTLLLQHGFPSWLYSVDQGATTIWERWNSYTKKDGFGSVNMNSFNHYSYGAVLEWMYAYMAGIKADPKSPGFRHFILAPHPDRRVGFVTASYRSPAGPIESSWKYGADGAWTWTFAIPQGTTATVILPNGRTAEYEAGRYSVSDWTIAKNPVK